MNHNRRRLLLCSASTLLLPVHSALASSNYPNRPITFICPWPLGGTADLTMRALQGWLVAMNEQRLAQFLNVPTLRDAGFNVVFNAPNGIAAPAGLDPLIQLMLRHALKRSLQVQNSSKYVILSMHLSCTRMLMNILTTFNLITNIKRI